jgi:hypothetical protein
MFLLGWSLHTWETLMLVFLGVAAFAAAVVGWSTYAVVQLQKQEAVGSKRELDSYKVEASEKIAASAALGETAKADASKANEAAERAKAEAARANLELARIKAPRALTSAQQNKIVEEMRPFAKTPVVFGAFQDPEAFALLDQLSNTLLLAGWIEEEWKSGGDIVLTRGGTHPVAGFTAVTGLYVQADVRHSADFSPIATKLAKLLSDAGIEAKAEVGRMGANTNNDAIKILIGQKPR